MNKTARNERRKLRATYLNGIAIALVAVGGLSPVAALVQTGVIAFGTMVLVVVCFCTSLALHSWAGWFLRELEE